MLWLITMSHNQREFGCLDRAGFRPTHHRTSPCALANGRGSARRMLEPRERDYRMCSLAQAAAAPDYQRFY
jgi:hypothetical protein